MKTNAGEDGEKMKSYSHNLIETAKESL